MSRQMKISDMARWARQEARAALRLGPLVLIVLLLVAFFLHTGSAAESGLFQSSPVETPPPTPTLTATPAIIPSVTTAPTSGATEQPTEGPTPEPTAPEPTATGEVTPTQPPAATDTPTPSDQPQTATPVPSPTGFPGEASPTPDEDQRYAEGESNLKFEWSMLFDSVALLLSYLWLCCGGLLFLAIPLMFVILWVVGRRRQEQEE